MNEKAGFKDRRLDALDKELRSLSYEQQLIFLVTSIARQDLRFQMTFLVNWIKALRESKIALRTITKKASAAYVTHGFAKKDTSTIEALLETRIENNPDKTPSKLAGECLGQLGIDPKMKPMLMAAINLVKKRRRQRKAKAAKRSQAVLDRVLSEETSHLSWQVPAITPAAGPVVDDDAELTSTVTPEDFEALVAPFRPATEKLMGSSEGLDDLLRVLYEEGEVPSLVLFRGKSSDIEYRALKAHTQFLSVFRNLTVYDHTYHVVSKALTILTERHKDPELLSPCVIMAALGHDLGKAPSLYEKAPVRNEGHQRVSETLVQGFLAGCYNKTAVKYICNAILNHHNKQSDDDEPTAAILFEADAKAREQEILAADPSYTAQPFSQWEDGVEDVLKRILPQVNKLYAGDKWDAVSWKGNVYVRPFTVFKIIAEVGRLRRLLDYRLVRSSYMHDQYPVLIEFVGMLRNLGLLAHGVRQGFYGPKHVVSFSDPVPQHVAILIPIKGEAFAPAKPSELERRKEGKLKLMVSVRPVNSPIE